MAGYQNISTQVQVQGPAEIGMAADIDTNRERTSNARFSSLPGVFGNAQLGPVYLGPVHLGSFGLIAVVSFAAWFFIIGMNFWAQVTYLMRKGAGCAALLVLGIWLVVAVIALIGRQLPEDSRGASDPSPLSYLTGPETVLVRPV